MYKVYTKYERFFIFYFLFMTEAGGEKAREEGGNKFILRHTNAKNAKKYLTDVTVLQSCFFVFAVRLPTQYVE